MQNGICCDSCGAERSDEIRTIYIPSCNSVILLLMAVIVMISIINNTTTHNLIGFAVAVFPFGERNRLVAEIF
jgi:hypothetical protein